jgi:hypothetical protein
VLPLLVYISKIGRITEETAAEVLNFLALLVQKYKY